MITESTMDYGTGIVTILFDGDRPSYDAVREYCNKNYGFKPFGFTVAMPSEYKGMVNPGVVTTSAKLRSNT